MTGRVRNQKLAAAELVAKVRSAVATGVYYLLPHARLRCTEREVPLPDIEHVFAVGHPVAQRDRCDEPNADWSYCFERTTVDNKKLRIVVAFAGRMLIVTVVRLDAKKEN